MVVKVRYPGVRAAIDDDLRQLARIIKSARVLQIDAASLDGSLAEIRARLHEEADYRIERQNLARFSADTRVPGVHLPEAIDALLDVWPIFEAFQLTYVSKGLLLEQEKNVSALSPNGPSAGASDTAKPARKSARTARRG